MKAAVLGSPVGHSLSPALHRAAYAALGLDDWTYQAIECDEARLPGLLGSLGSGWAGLSLTMPLKRAVMGLVDWTEPVAAEAGAVNTVVFAAADDGAGRGARNGYNTDVGGIGDALAASAVAPASALIIGAGATACSALAAMRGIGLPKATVAVRSASRAGDLVAAAERIGIEVELTDVDHLADPGGVNPPGWQPGGLIVSTIPPGAGDRLAGSLKRLDPPPVALLDVVYDPWPTSLAAAAREAGAVVIGGFELLLHQAARQVALMTGMEPPVEAMRAAGLSAMPGRGW